MILLRCKVCDGEVNIVGNERLINKKIQCSHCGFNNLEDKKELIIIKKRP